VLAREIARAARSHGGLLLFTDYDATLRPGVRARRNAGLPLLVRGALVALATASDTRVVISSDEDAGDLEAQINVPGVVYAGCRGLQIRGAGMAFCHPVAARVRARLPLLARQLSESLASLRGVEVEIKELGVAVHVRRADPAAVPVVVAQAEELIRTSGREFRLWESEATVHLYPDLEWRRGSSALWIMEQWVHDRRGRPVVVYFGSDDADEDAYLALRRHGYAVHVGRLRGDSAASHWMVDQAAAVDLLARIAFCWTVESPER
jgi:trehalose-phosphatase